LFKPIEQPFGSNNCIDDQTIPQTYAMTCIIITSKLHINKLGRGAQVQGAEFLRRTVELLKWRHKSTVHIERAGYEAVVGGPRSDYLGELPEQ
jgi:hypothetical protein